MITKNDDAAAAVGTCTASCQASCGDEDDELSLEWIQRSDEGSALFGRLHRLWYGNGSNVMN